VPAARRSVEAIFCNEAEISPEVLQIMLYELGYDLGTDESHLVDV